MTPEDEARAAFADLENLERRQQVLRALAESLTPLHCPDKPAPDWQLRMEAEEDERLHRLERHDGAVCDCPAPEWPASEDPWDAEAPF